MFEISWSFFRDIPMSSSSSHLCESCHHNILFVFRNFSSLLSFSWIILTLQERYRRFLCCNCTYFIKAYGPGECFDMWKFRYLRQTILRCLLKTSQSSVIHFPVFLSLFPDFVYRRNAKIFQWLIFPMILVFYSTWLIISDAKQRVSMLASKLLDIMLVSKYMDLIDCPR